MIDTNKHNKVTKLSTQTHIVTDIKYLSSKLVVGMSEKCLIFDFASLPLELARLIEPTLCTNLAIYHQTFISVAQYQSSDIIPNVSTTMTFR